MGRSWRGYIRLGANRTGTLGSAPAQMSATWMALVVVSPVHGFPKWHVLLQANLKAKSSLLLQQLTTEKQNRRETSFFTGISPQGKGGSRVHKPGFLLPPGGQLSKVQRRQAALSLRVFLYPDPQKAGLSMMCQAGNLQTPGSQLHAIQGVPSLPPTSSLSSSVSGGFQTLNVILSPAFFKIDFPL